MTVTTGNRQFLDQVDVVNPNFFQIIQLPLIAGDPRQPCSAQPEFGGDLRKHGQEIFRRRAGDGKNASASVRSASLAEPELQGACVVRQADVLVTGVMRDLPHNTQLTGDVFIPNTSSADPMSPE